MTTGFSPRLKAFFLDEWSITKFYMGEYARDLSYTVINGATNEKSRTMLTLHDGPNEDSPVIARIPKTKTWSSTPDSLAERIKIVISIPSYGSTEQNPTTVFMGRVLTHIQWHFHFAFKMRIGRPGHFHTEKFEWRRSKGDEVRNIHPHARGYKLVRVGREGPGGGSGGERHTRPRGESSDGKEVVAVWGTTGHMPHILPTTRRPFTFYFCGSGNTGELGEEWRTTAIVTALKLYSITEEDMEPHSLDPNY
ncbi:hypothetical protein GGR53DRAFT_532333 [Hypoxylon sp. FL1150]|nr:hypothetical protein GGR53DRAFT_532333 [Hypoxylon sp. FL1150]